MAAAAAGAAAAGLSIAAQAARTAYVDLVKQADEASGLFRKRLAYGHDLGALDTAMKFSLPSSSEVISQIAVVRDAWASCLQEIKYKVGELDVNNLSSGPWLRDEEMAASAANWTKVDDAMRAFVGGAFVDATVIPFGGVLPQDDPDWQRSFLRKAAA
jgi:hypothetical protein